MGCALLRCLWFIWDGKLLLFVIFGIGFGVVNFGNNLLYLVLGVLLSFIMVSGVFSEFIFRSLFGLCGELFVLYVGEFMFVRIDICNGKKWFMILFVEVMELVDDYYGLE